MSDKPKLAILMLCCRDYEAVELALACHMAYGDPKVPFFALQNCRGDYDAERTYEGVQRYQSLYPGRVRVLDRYAPDLAYRNIRRVLQAELHEYDLIFKVDDDCFPIEKGWLDRLRRTWTEARVQHGDRLAYVTPLINNNNWGFPETLRALGLEDEFLARFNPPDPARYGPRIWESAHIARWLHEHTTLQPDRFIGATRRLAPVMVPSDELYSIGGMLFQRDLWEDMDDGGTRDELMLFKHCREHDLAIVCERSVPFVHLSYYPQREQLRDVVRAAAAVYAPRLNLIHPIGLKVSPTDEIESRLRFIESRIGEMDARARGLEAPKEESAPAPRIHDPDRRFIGRKLDELLLEEEAARESAALQAAHMARAARTARPVETLRHALSLAPRGGIALEFGVGSGGTLRVIADARGDGRVWGFDSFKGLPEQWRPGYPAGEFAVKEIPAVPGAELVVGLFDKTLPQFLVEHTDPVDFVHVDCDLYSSTRTVLAAIQHRLRPGSVLSFDEYFNYPGWQEHEHRAWTEFVQRTGLKFSYEVFTWGDEQVAVRIQ